MALFIYGTATNTGKGFFTAEDRRAFFLRGFPGTFGSLVTTKKAHFG
jgi:hypothetical protein